MNNKWLTPHFLPITLLLMLSLAIAACGPQPDGATSAPSLTNSVASTSTPSTNSATSSSTSTTSTHATPTASAATNTSKQTSTGTNTTAANNTSTTTTSSSTSSQQNCGTISLSPLQVRGAAPAQQVGGCFWQAYQQCSSATMVVNATGMDTVTSHSLLIEKKDGGCEIVDTLSKALAPKPATVTTYTCTGMTNNNGTLRLTGCGTEGDIIIPLH